MGDYIVLKGVRYEVNAWTYLDSEDGENWLEVVTSETPTEGQADVPDLR